MGFDAGTGTAQLHNLPLQPTPLIGRAQELMIARQQLLSGEVRMLTLTGPGGVGKTRLALAIAADLLEHFADGVWFVDLAAVADPGLVLSAIAQVVGVHEAGNRPLAETLRLYLRERQLLLILDNFEHLLPAAPVLAGLLEGCPRLHLLVTSRERLRLRWEWTLVTSPLALPDLGRQLDLDNLAQVASVALFVQRTQASRAGFVLTPENAPAIAAICAQLDGLPLAIELAAARVNVLAPADILARMEQRLALLRRGGPDLPARHQTLQATIGWSYDLLLVEEQRLFRRLGVFMGGWTLAAAEAVAGPSEVGEDVLDSLSTLAEKSLVRVIARPGEESRYGMLETIRDYTLAQLTANGELEATRRRHANYYVTLAEQTLTEAKGARQRVWFDYLEREHDNLRAALRWSMEDGEPLLGLRIAAALWFFWWLRGHVSEGRRWLEVGLARNPEAPEPLRLAALEGLGTLVGWQTEYEQGAALLDEALELAQRLGNSSDVARLLGRLGWIAWLNGRSERADELIQALRACRQTADAWSLAYAFLSVGSLLYEVGQAEAAIATLEESSVYFRDVEENHGLGFALTKLALLRNNQGEAGQAQGLAQEGMAFVRGLQDAHAIAYCADDVAHLIAASGSSEPLARLLGGVDYLRETLSLLRTPGEQAAHRKLVEALQRRLGEEAFTATWSAGQELSIDQIAEEALTLLAQTLPSQPSFDDHPATPSPATIALSERESEVLRLVAEGLSNQQIADKLFITERTVRFHVTSIFNKLGADNRAQAVALASQQGLL